MDPVSAVSSAIAGLGSSILSTWATIETADEQVQIAEANAAATTALATAQTAAAQAASTASASTIGATIAANPLTTAGIVLAFAGILAWGLKR